MAVDRPIKTAAVASPVRPSAASPYGRAVVIALLITVVIGVWLRWALAGVAVLPLPFTHLRHAHSHMGYFGLLFPLAWLGWRQAKVDLPGHRTMAVYGCATTVSIIGFLRAGYGPLAIIGSTIVAGVWIVSMRPLVPRMRDPTYGDPLAVVPLGIILSLACIPPIAVNLRSDPGVAHGFVATFLSGLLLLVILPSALASAHVSVKSWPAFLTAGVLGALFLGASPNAFTRLGLVGYGWLLGGAVFSPRLSLHVRLAWLAVVLGLMGLAVGWLPNNRPTAVGALHFIILGPVLATLTPQWLGAAPPPWFWWVGHAAWGSMSLALVTQGMGMSAGTGVTAAIAGTATAAWWIIALLWAARTTRGSASPSQPS